MNTLFRLALVALPISACVDGTLTDDTDDPTPDAFCMEDADADGSPDVFPTTGPLSAGNYADCEVFTGDPIISYFPKPECGAGGWSIVVETKGWTSGGSIYVHDSAGGNANKNFWWGEEHDLKQGSSEPNQWWDSYTLDLPIVAETSQQVDSTNSYHKCASNNDTTLVWGYEVFDVENPATRVDCVIISMSATTDGFVDEFISAYPNFNGCDTFGFTDK